MLKAACQLMQRDLLLALRRRSDALMPLAFFLVTTTLFPLAIGPDTKLLRSVAPGIVRGPAAIEYAIRRGGSQMGVPYSWGGGKPTGPTRGIDSGANTVGFDCSGLTQFSYAGVGVLIPKYSGDQYNTGRKVPLAQAKRGDLLFWGPGGSQHVAMYLGGGRMLEASGSAGKVTVSPVRTSGLQPYAARIIES